MRSVILLGMISVLGTGLGCANARYIRKDRDGGVIAMSSNSDSNREKAHKLMAEHVGPSYQIVEEHEVVTGQSTTNLSDTQKELTMNSQNPFLPAEKRTTTTTTTTRDLTEWHIVYRRQPGTMAPGQLSANPPPNAIVPTAGTTPGAAAPTPTGPTSALAAPSGAVSPVPAPAPYPSTTPPAPFPAPGH